MSLDAISETTIREALLERICGYVQKILVPYADSLLSISLEGPSRSDRQSSNGKHKDRDNPYIYAIEGDVTLWVQSGFKSPILTEALTHFYVMGYDRYLLCIHLSDLCR